MLDRRLEQNKKEIQTLKSKPKVNVAPGRSNPRAAPGVSKFLQRQYKGMKEKAELKLKIENMGRVKESQKKL